MSRKSLDIDTIIDISNKLDHKYYEGKMGYTISVNEYGNFILVCKYSNIFEHEIIISFYKNHKYTLNEKIINNQSYYIDGKSNPIRVTNLKIERMNEQNGLKTKQLIFDNKIIKKQIISDLKSLGYKKILF